MKYKRLIIIICAVLFFVAALTTYINRVVFPQLIKKVAIERMEGVLKRKVEIGSIRFSWVRGFIVDKIKIYEKGSDQIVFAQAQQVNFGVLLFPGKRYRITIPYINVRSVSVHLIRISDNTWNFSDIYASPQMGTTPTSSVSALTKTEKVSNYEIAWGGITISDGKLLLEDTSGPHQWNEYFDNINLKLSLSYKGISYDLGADIPRKNGSLGATVYYQPITQNTQAHIHLKNIDTSSYLTLVNMPDVRVDSGIIQEIDLNINHTQDKTAAQGSVIIKKLDITSQDQNFKGDIEIRGLDAQYENGDISARGQMALNNIQTQVPGLSAAGSVQTRVNEFELTKDGLSFIGSLRAQNIRIGFKDRQVQIDGVILDNIKVRKDKDGIQSVGSVKTQGLFVQWPDQRLQGDLFLKAVTMRMKDENDISLEGEVGADNFSTTLYDKTLTSKHILLENAQLNITDQKNITLITKLSLNDMMLEFGKNIFTSGSLVTNKLSLHLNDGIIKASSTITTSKAQLVLDHHKTISADPQLELTLQMPLKAPQELTYKGSLTLSNGQIQGFPLCPSLDNIELDADFQNDAATINALSVNILDTNLRVTGTVKNFQNPFLNITADADELNLAKINDLFPQITAQYGLTFSGASFVKVKFEGLISDPLAAKILAMASVKNATMTSSQFHQRIKNITGIIEATPDSLKWRDTTATYLGKKYTLSGSLEDFKNPKIIAGINGPDLQFKADLTKEKNLITINSLTGKYINAFFNSTGTITLREGREPVLDISTTASFLLEDLAKNLPAPQRKSFESLNPTGIISLTADLKGSSMDWKHYTLNALVTCPIVRLMGYKLTDLKINLDQERGKIKDLTLNGKFYDGTIHAVGSMDLSDSSMPYDLAFNIDSTDLHQLKMDSPLRMNEINGKFYFTTLAHGTVADFKNKLHATGSLAIRDGYLGEFNLFKGLLDVLNDAVSLSKVMITDVEANFTIDDQKLNTENLRLKGPTIVLLGRGWVNFDQICDLNMTVDLSSGVFPAMAHDVLKSLSIRVYDKISAPKFKKKISVPQVINTLFKNLWQ